MRRILRLILHGGLWVYLAGFLTVLGILLYIETIAYYWLVALPIPVLAPHMILGRFMNTRAYIVCAILGVTALVLGRVVLDLWLPLR